VAEGPGVSTNQLHTWRHEYGAAKAEQRVARGGETLEEEVQRLRREIQAVKADREVLKKSIAFFVKGL
jgi:transposase-like protein